MKLTAAACLLFGLAAAGDITAQDGTNTLSAMSENEVLALVMATREPAEKAEEESIQKEGEPETSGQMGARSAVGDWDYCKHRQCGENEGDCDNNRECTTGLVCGFNNCDSSLGFHALTDCCERLKPFHWDYCRYMNCGHGEGDCDCHEQCGSGLMCGVNNCRRMHPNLGNEIHRKTDCCTRCSTVKLQSGMDRPVKVEPQYWDANLKISNGDRTLSNPPFILQSTAVYSLRPLTDVDTIQLRCCRYRKEECQFFVSVYNCRPCSDRLNGGLPATLTASGWTAGSCSPRFMEANDLTRSHALITFHKTLQPGERVTIPVGMDAPHVVVYEQSGSLAGPWCSKPVGPNPPGTCGCIASASMRR